MAQNYFAVMIIPAIDRKVTQQRAFCAGFKGCKVIYDIHISLATSFAMRQMLDFYLSLYSENRNSVHSTKNGAFDSQN